MNRALTVKVLESLDLHSALGSAWEQLVRGNTASGVMQSLHWRDAKNLQGLLSFHVCVFRDDKLLGGAIFYTSRKRNGVGMLVAPEGPVLPWEDEDLSREALRLIIDCARENASSLGVMAIRAEPRIAPPTPPILREFERGPVDLVPQETLYLDLTKDIDVLLAEMKPKGRYNIRLAQRHGVKVEQDNSRVAVGKFYAIMKEVSVRDDFVLEPFTFFENLAAVLTERGCLRFLFAEHEGDLLGTLMMVTYGSRATYLYGGVSNQKRNLMGGYALQWTAITAAKSEGCSVYDFYGFDPFRSADHPYARFSQFKSQFGGDVRRFIGAHDLIFTEKLVDAFIQIANEAASKSAAGVKGG